MDYEYGSCCAKFGEGPQPNEFNPEQEALDTEFRKEFPPDHQIGSETDEAARVWKVYRKKAEAADNTLLEGWGATLDVLLIFAGLFSAVATAFVIESYQLLQPDNAAYAAAALFILVAASNHSTGIMLPPPPDIAYKSTSSRWINGLWFTSIILSLAVALLSILAKQWITQYRARNSAPAKSPRDWARRHHLFFQALHAWPIAELVSFLPVLLHLSLFLFFSGVVIFLWTLDKAIGVWIIVLGIVLAVFYLACTLVPLWIPACPTSTPLVNYIRKVGVLLMISFLRFLTGILHLTTYLKVVDFFVHFRRMGMAWPASNVPTGVLPAATASHRVFCLSTTLAGRLPSIVASSEDLRSDTFAIRIQLQEQRDYLDASALHWIITSVVDSDAVAVGLQALGGVHPKAPLADHLRAHKDLEQFSYEAAFTRSSTSRTPAEVLRVGRSKLCMSRESHEDISVFTCSPPDLLHNDEYPALALLSIPPQHVAQKFGFRDDAHSSLTSTAILMLRTTRGSPVRSLAYLACCDFSLFSHDDWDIALQAMIGERITHGALEGSHESVKLLGLAAVVAGTSVQSDEPWIANVVDRLISRLLGLETSIDMGDINDPPADCYARVLLDDAVLAFLGSQRFYSRGCKSNVHNAAALCLRQSVQHRRTLDENVWHALQRVFCGVLSRELDSFNVRTCILALIACWGSIKRLSIALNAIYEDVRVPPGWNRSIWKTLYREISGVDDHWLMLADTLAASLCLSVRNIPYLPDHRDTTRGCVDVFFQRLNVDHSSIRDVFAKLISYRMRTGKCRSSLDSRDRAVHFIRHCNELREGWWSQALSAAHIWDSSGGELDAQLPWLLDIDKEANQLGPCRACPLALGYPVVSGL